MSPRLLTPALVGPLLAITLGALPGCEQTRRGAIELHWSLGGDGSPSACGRTGVATIRVLYDHTGRDPDNDPSRPQWPFQDFACADMSAQLTLPEGIYRLRLAALDGGQTLVAPVVERLGVEVVHGTLIRIPPRPEPAVDLEIPVCGDGEVQSGEACDGSNLGEATCDGIGFDSGRLSCRSDCTFDTSACDRCGDGVATGPEACDASDLAGADCVSLGFTGGQLHCDAVCGYRVDGCLGCGNGIVEAAEGCDDGNTTPGDGCSADCQLERGDLVVTWDVYATDASTLSDCATEGMQTVSVVIRHAGENRIAAQADLPCSAAQFTAVDLGFGLYSVALEATDAGGQTVANATSPAIDHARTQGTTVALDLVP